MGVPPLGTRPYGCTAETRLRKATVRAPEYFKCDSDTLPSRSQATRSTQVFCLYLGHFGRPHGTAVLEGANTLPFSSTNWGGLFPPTFTRMIYFSFFTNVVPPSARKCTLSDHSPRHKKLEQRPRHRASQQPARTIDGTSSSFDQPG